MSLPTLRVGWPRPRPTVAPSAATAARRGQRAGDRSQGVRIATVRMSHCYPRSPSPAVLSSPYPPTHRHVHVHTFPGHSGLRLCDAGTAPLRGAHSRHSAHSCHSAALYNMHFLQLPDSPHPAATCACHILHLGFLLEFATACRSKHARSATLCHTHNCARCGPSRRAPQHALHTTAHADVPVHMFALVCCVLCACLLVSVCVHSRCMCRGAVRCRWCLNSRCSVPRRARTLRHSTAALYVSMCVQR